jgi:hypothetical protein
MGIHYDRSSNDSRIADMVRIPGKVLLRQIAITNYINPF